MRRGFAWQPPESRGDCIGQSDYAQKRSGDFNLRPPGTRHEVFHQQRHDQQQTKDDAANPQGNWHPLDTQLLFGRELKEKHAGTGENRARKHEPCAEDQRDAVLRTLEANKSNGGENKSQKAGDNLNIALERRVSVERHRPQPQREKQDQKQRHHMPEDRRRFPPLRIEGPLAHRHKWPLLGNWARSTIRLYWELVRCRILLYVARSQTGHWNRCALALRPPWGNKRCCACRANSAQSVP